MHEKENRRRERESGGKKERDGMGRGKIIR